MSLDKADRKTIEQERTHWLEQMAWWRARAVWPSWASVVSVSEAAAYVGDCYAHADLCYGRAEDAAWELRHDEMLPPGFSFY